MRDSAADARRRGDGHGAVHVARAGRGPRRRSPHATSSRSASCSTRWPAGSGRSTARRRPSWPRRSCATRRRRFAEVRADLPHDLARVIERCLEKNAADRFASARDVGDGCAASRQAQPVASTTAADRPRPVGRGRLGRGARRRRVLGRGPAVQVRRAPTPISRPWPRGCPRKSSTGLSRFSLPPSDRAQFHACATPNETADVRAVGKELGARYVMEGSLRQAGSMLRLAVQLVDAELWRTSVGGDLRPPLQSRGRLRAAGRSRSPHRLDCRRHVRRAAAQHQRDAPAEGPQSTEPVRGGAAQFWLLRAHHPRRACEGERRPGTGGRHCPWHADCWAILSMLHKDEHTHGFNVRPDPLGRALAAAHRAVEAAPANHLAAPRPGHGPVLPEGDWRSGMPRSARSRSTRWTEAQSRLSGS